MQLGAVILAGGESKRMGRDKAWVEFSGRPLIAHAVDKITALGVREIFISGRAGQDFSAWKLPVLFDLEPGFGPLGGIERALHEIAFEPTRDAALLPLFPLPTGRWQFLHWRFDGDHHLALACQTPECDTGRTEAASCRFWLWDTETQSRHELTDEWPCTL